MPSFPEKDPVAVHLLDELPRPTPVAGVASRLLEYLTSGDIPVGTKLPPERELAANLKVGRSAIRGALAALEVLGIVEIRPGSGSYLAGTSSELLPQTLRWGVMLGSTETSELLQIRSELEVLASRLAAEQVHDADIEFLTKCVEEQEASFDSVERFVEGDQHFHARIAKVAGNHLLADLLSTSRSLLRIWFDRSVEDQSEMVLAVTEHRAVLTALSIGEGAPAAEAMRTHMVSANRRLQTQIGSEQAQ